MAPIRRSLKSSSLRTGEKTKVTHTAVLPRAPCSKVHKRAAKHGALIARMKETAAAYRTAKRRRPSKKLVTDLASLEAALPDTNAVANNQIDNQLKRQPRAGVIEARRENDPKIKHKSLKSRPGAGKRKERLLKGERERFAKNLALMATGRHETGESGKKIRKELSNDVQMEKAHGDGRVEMRDIGIHERWAAMRDFIARTMEKKADTENI